MNFKKRIILISMVSMIISLFIGCGNNSMDSIYDDNSKIANESDSFGLDKSNETIETESYKGYVELSGSGTVWRYKSNEDFDLEITYNLSVNSGKAKIVLISPDGTVVTLVENTEKAIMEGETSITLPIKKGDNRIKIIGYKKADIDIKLHIDEGTFEIMGF